MTAGRKKERSGSFFPELMNISKATLPLWVFLWVTAFVVLIDIAVLRAEPKQAVVVSYQERRVLKGSVCDLALRLSSGTYTRTTDNATCHELEKGSVLTLKSTKLTGRWLGLYDQYEVPLTGTVLESRFIQDVIFVLLAGLVYFVGHIFIAPNLIFGVLLFGAGYYWILIFQ